MNNENKKDNAQIKQNIKDDHLAVYQRGLDYIQTNYLRIRELLI